MGPRTKATVGAARLARVLFALAAVLIALGTWALLTSRPRAGGAASLAASTAILAGAIVTRRGGGPLERILDSFMDRAFDGAILGAIAWSYRASEPAVSAGALVAMAAGFLGSYVRARGESLGYGVEESPVTRGIRYLLVSLGPLAGWLHWTVWAAAGESIVAAGVRASQVAKEERQ